MASLDCLGALPQFSIIFIYRMGRMCALFVCRNSTFGAFLYCPLWCLFTVPGSTAHCAPRPRLELHSNLKYRFLPLSPELRIDRIFPQTTFQIFCLHFNSFAIH